MSLSIGIVGLPNAGKSTLFQALTKKEVTIANYPFATISPNVGIVEVPDERLDKIATLFASQKKVPAVVEFVDIAGLVKGASKGEGLGNQFLANIREVQAICHVVRAFRDEDILHVADSIDPMRDMDIVQTELILKDLETVERRLQSIEKDARVGRKEAVALKEALEGVRVFFDQGRSAREFLLQEPDAQDLLRDLNLLSAKPRLVAISANNEAEVPEEFREYLKSSGIPFTIMNMKEELEISSLEPTERDELQVASRLPDLIRSAYALLNLITFFTAGEKESRAWTILEGTKAPEAAGVIHSDFCDKFIRAQAIDWKNLVEARGYKDAQAKGLVRTEGKEYVVRDGDVLEIWHG